MVEYLLFLVSSLTTRVLGDSSCGDRGRSTEEPYDGVRSRLWYGAGTGIEFLPLGMVEYDLEPVFVMAMAIDGPPNSWVVVVVVMVDDDFLRLSIGVGSKPCTGGRESG
jgi:hypothetical protein